MRFDTSAVNMTEQALNEETSEFVVVQSGLPSMMESERNGKSSSSNVIVSMGKTVSSFEAANLNVL